MWVQMAEYKCINCAEIKEAGSPCTCPVCGYRMFEMPYDRNSILYSEIKNFISRLEITSVQRDDLIFVGKDEDERRFPEYNQILKYVTGKKRTEEYIGRLLETISQLVLHFSNRFEKTYSVSFEKLDDFIKRYDSILVAAEEILIPDNSVELEPVKWINTSLLYAESPNKYLWFSASELLELALPVDFQGSRANHKHRESFTIPLCLIVSFNY